jgi:hypothetical protein
VNGGLEVHNRQRPPNRLLGIPLGAREIQRGVDIKSQEQLSPFSPLTLGYQASVKGRYHFTVRDKSRLG